MNLRKYSNSTTEYIYYNMCMSKTACVRFIQRTECDCKGTIRRKRCQVFPIVFSFTGTKKGLQSHLTLKTLIKEGSYLLSHIALQYHRRKRA